MDVEGSVEEEEKGTQDRMPPAMSYTGSSGGERGNKTISAAKVESLKDQMKYLLNRHRLLVEQDVYEV